MASYDITVKLVDQTKSSMSRIEAGLKGIAATASKTQASLDKMTGGLTRAGAVAGAALGLAARAAVGYAASINDASEATDISRQSILALGQAMAVNGGEAAKATDAIIKLNENIGSAQAGAGSAANALYELGLSYADIKNLSPQQQFETVVAALGNIESSTQAAKLSTELFGKALKGVNVRGLASEYAALVGKQNDTADAIKKVGQASDNLNAAWIRIQGSIVKALAPAAEFINKLSPAQIDGLVSSIGQLAAALVGVTAGLKLFSLIATGIGVVAGYWLLFTKGAVQAGTTIAGLGIRWGGFMKGLASATGLFAKFGQLWTFLGNTITKTIPYLLGGFARMIPLIGTIIAVGSILNSIIKAIFEIDIIDTFIGKVKDAYSALKSFVGIKGPTFLSPEENDNELKRMQNRANAAQAAAGAPTPGAPKNKFIEETNRTLEETTKNYNELSAAMKQTSSLNQLALIFAKLSSEAETLGIVLAKPAALIQRDYAMAVKKAAEELRQHEIELANTTVTSAKWANELQATNLQIYEQSLKLMDSAYMQKLLNQEIAQGNMALLEQEARLKNAGYQSDKFSQLLKQTSIDTKQQQVNLSLLNDAFAKGQIPLATYAKLLANIDESLLGTNEKTSLVVNELNKQEKAWGDNFTVAGNVFQLYKEGKLSLKELELAYASLGEEYFNYEVMLKAALGSARLEANSNIKKAAALELLTKQFKEGKVAADAYRIAASNLGGDTDAIDRTVNVYGSARDQIIEDNEFIKKSIGSAAKTFSDEFTSAIMKGEFKFSSFKNFLNNILNDIAQRIIKRQFADPIAEYLTGMATQVFGKGGIIPTKAGEGAVSASDSMTTIFTGLAGKTKDIFSGMSDGISNIFGSMGSTLMDSMSGLFNWIMDGIGSIGSNMGGLGSSLSGLFSGGGGGSDLFGSVAGFFSGFFADGGTLGAGQWGIAGEAGPEMISGPATITPMTQDAQEPLVVNFTLNALDTQSGTEFLIKNKAVISKVIEDAYNRRGKRGPITA